MGLTVTGLSKIYARHGQEHQALKSVSFSAPTGAFVTLLGPSGCGKSTLLNLLAGLDRPSSGRIEVNGVAVYDGSQSLFMPPAKRNISMVFQSYAIWPHMTVRENIAFPLQHGRKRKESRAERERIVDLALEKVHLTAFADRPAPLLSGGQQQRVSLARAIAQSPGLILLDEPLSNLDANLREAMQKQIRSVVTDEGITAVYVTHDQKEALSMSDLIIVMNDGLIEQIGTPYEIYYQPRTRFVAQFMGFPNLVEATVSALDADAGRLTAQCALGPLLVSWRGDQVTAGDRITLVLRQEDFEPLPAGQEASSVENAFRFAIVQRVFLGERMELVCRAPDEARQTVSIYVNARAVPADAATIALRYQSDKIHYIRES